MIREGERLPPEVLEASLERAAGVPVALGDVVDGGPALVVFLRHFGCIGCADQVHGLLPRLAELQGLGVRVVLVGSGPAHHIDAFVERNALGDKPVVVVTDPSLAVHRRAGLHRSFWATYGPRAVVAFLRAFARGHRPRSTDGDLFQQGGAFLVEDGIVTFLHRNRTLGDHADPADAVDAALRISARRAGVLV